MLESARAKDPDGKEGKGERGLWPVDPSQTLSIARGRSRIGTPKTELGRKTTDPSQAQARVPSLFEVLFQLPSSATPPNTFNHVSDSDTTPRANAPGYTASVPPIPASELPPRVTSWSDDEPEKVSYFPVNGNAEAPTNQGRQASPELLASHPVSDDLVVEREVVGVDAKEQKEASEEKTLDAKTKPSFDGKADGISISTSATVDAVAAMGGSDPSTNATVSPPPQSNVFTSSVAPFTFPPPQAPHHHLQVFPAPPVPSLPHTPFPFSFPAHAQFPHPAEPSAFVYPDPQSRLPSPPRDATRMMPIPVGLMPIPAATATGLPLPIPPPFEVASPFYPPPPPPGVALPHDYFLPQQHQSVFSQPPTGNNLPFPSSLHAGTPGFGFTTSYGYGPAPPPPPPLSGPGSLPGGGFVSYGTDVSTPSTESSGVSAQGSLPASGDVISQAQSQFQPPVQFQFQFDHYPFPNPHPHHYQHQHQHPAQNQIQTHAQLLRPFPRSQLASSSSSSSSQSSQSPSGSKGGGRGGGGGEDDGKERVVAVDRKIREMYAAHLMDLARQAYREHRHGRDQDQEAQQTVGDNGAGAGAGTGTGTSVAKVVRVQQRGDDADKVDGSVDGAENQGRRVSAASSSAASPRGRSAGGGDGRWKGRGGGGGGGFVPASSNPDPNPGFSGGSGRYPMFGGRGGAYHNNGGGLPTRRSSAFGTAGRMPSSSTSISASASSSRNLTGGGDGSGIHVPHHLPLGAVIPAPATHTNAIAFRNPPLAGGGGGGGRSSGRDDPSSRAGTTNHEVADAPRSSFAFSSSSSVIIPPRASNGGVGGGRGGGLRTLPYAHFAHRAGTVGLLGNSTGPKPIPEANVIDVERIEQGLDTRTTVMLKNVPNKVRRGSEPELLG